jgi:hypothetical protein
VLLVHSQIPVQEEPIEIYYKEHHYQIAHYVHQAISALKMLQHELSVLKVISVMLFKLPPIKILRNVLEVLLEQILV